MSFEANVERVIAGQPYNIRRQAGRPDSEYDMFKEQELGEFLDLSKVGLEPDGHGYVCCSTLPFAE